MKINYKTFTKHAEKVAKAKHLASRPILQGIHHDDEGTLSVTDSHRLYRVHNVNAPRNAVLHAVTGEEIEGNYPDTSRLIPYKSDATDVINVNDVQELLKTLKAMMHAATIDGMKKDAAQVTIKDGVIHVESDAPIAFTYDFKADLTDSDSELILSLQYLTDAIDMLDDMKVGTAEIHLYGNLRPLYITPQGSEEVEIIILPVRRS